MDAYEALVRSRPGDQPPSLDDLIDRPDWMRDALCREYPAEWWFPARGEDPRPAKAVCGRCTVRDECAAYALEQDWWLEGIWAGMSRRDRRRLRAGRVA